MYRELLGEMFKKGLNKNDLAKEIGVAEKTLRNKLKGKTDFTWSEVKKIRDIVAPNYTIEELFEKDDVKS